jgi:putative DNA primase/helicase
MTAEALAKSLGGYRAGATWMARCPAHDDSNPSLSISKGKYGKMLVHCHAGCEQRKVIAALVERGLWEVTGKHTRRIHQKHTEVLATQPDPDTSGRTSAALSIWYDSLCIAGSVAETYMRTRGITLSLPPSLRFHPRMKHPSGGVWPVLVALVTDGETGLPIAIHRTFIARDGRGKAAVNPSKMMLGPCRGGVARLGHPSRVLMVGEGIETCLAAIQATGTTAWAALSTSGLRSLNLPRTIREIILLADGDEPGESAVQDCAKRLHREGRSTRIARPPSGMDFNDLLVRRGSAFKEASNEH